MLVVPIRKAVDIANHQSGGGEGGGGGNGALSGGTPIGVIQCINKLGASVNSESLGEDGAPVFTGEDERRLIAFTAQITPILEKVTYKKRAPRTKNQLGSDWVQNIATLAGLDVYTVVKVTLDRMRDLVLADRASMFLHDRKKKQLWSKIADDIAEIRLPSNAGIVGAVCQAGEALNIEDACAANARNPGPSPSPHPPHNPGALRAGTRTCASTGASTPRQATARAPSCACQ